MVCFCRASNNPSVHIPFLQRNSCFYWSLKHTSAHSLKGLAPSNLCGLNSWRKKSLPLLGRSQAKNRFHPAALTTTRRKLRNLLNSNTFSCAPLIKSLKCNWKWFWVVGGALVWGRGRRNIFTLNSQHYLRQTVKPGPGLSTRDINKASCMRAKTNGSLRRTQMDTGRTQEDNWTTSHFERAHVPFHACDQQTEGHWWQTNARAQVTPLLLWSDLQLPFTPPSPVLVVFKASCVEVTLWGGKASFSETRTDPVLIHLESEATLFHTLPPTRAPDSFPSL